MSAYPELYISRTSSISADAGIRAEVADDGTLKYRRDRSITAYGLQIVHEWITQSDLDTLLAFVESDGFGPHTVTLHGIDFTITLVNEPEIADRKGGQYMVVSKAIGVKA